MPVVSCAHCDSTLPHEHVDVGAVVRARRRALLAWSAAYVGVLAVAAAALSALSPTTAPGPLPLLLAGALGWAATTAAGVITAGLANQGRPDRRAEANLALGAMASGALTPVAALAVALLLGSAGPGRAAAWAGLGWLAAASAAEVASRLRTRALLLAPGDAGERARATAVHLRAPRDGAALLGALAAAATFALWLAVLALMPVLVLVLVPLHAATVALLALRKIRSPEPATAARLRG